MFIKSDKTVTDKEASIIIRSFGFSSQGEGHFIYHAGNSQCQIMLREKGIWIKAYSSGYGESDFLNKPYTKEQLQGFIRSNCV
jgi:hypothetical protein